MTDHQVVLLRHKLVERKTPETGSAMAAMRVKAARKWRRGPLPSVLMKRRRRRTRPYPLAEKDVEPSLRSNPEGGLSATTILERLEEMYRSRYGKSQLRTLQRRVRDCRALHGPDREVCFHQDHPSGREAYLDDRQNHFRDVTGEPMNPTRLLAHWVNHASLVSSKVVACRGKTSVTTTQSDPSTCTLDRTVFEMWLGGL